MLFSSHLLDEVELMSDYVTMIHEGKVALNGALDEIKERHRHLTIQFGAPRSQPPELAGALSVEGSGRVWTAVCNGGLEGIQETLSKMGARMVEERNASLQDIFVAHVGRKCHSPEEE